MEIADIMIYHFSWNFLQLRCEGGRQESLFVPSTCLTMLSTCVLVVDDTVDGKTNLEEKTREADHK